MSGTSPVNKLLLPILLVVGGLSLVIMPGGFLFMLLAMLPTFMAYFMDHTPNKSAFKTVLACNLAATVPTLLPMIKGSAQVKHADIYTIMSTPSVWLFVYGGAAAGWCLIYLCRLVSRLFVVLSYEYKIVALERMQKKLLEEWGQQLQKKSSE